MNELTINDIKQEACRLRFGVEFHRALSLAGGHPDFSKWENMTLREVVEQLAHNGIVVSFDINNHISKIGEPYTMDAAVRLSAGRKF